ncbi:hypothetical protein ERO13_A09G203801v2 [Gossypium hirsutum]|nr:hypothetical protein ERO13_A09G203801v2 [Gossypium hirsutum]
MGFSTSFRNLLKAEPLRTRKGKNRGLLTPFWVRLWQRWRAPVMWLRGTPASCDAWKRRQSGAWWPRHAAAEAWKG